MKLFKKWLFNFSDKFESIKAFIFIRRGLTAATPLIIIGAISLMLTSLPLPVYQDFITSIFGGRLISIFSLVSTSCFNMLSLYMIIVISYHYTSSYTDDHREAMIVSLISIASYCVLNGNIKLGQSTEIFDATQLFSAIVCALATGTLYQFLRSKSQSKDTYFTLNSDTGFSTSIKSILPATIIILFFALMNLLITNIFNVQSIQGLFTMAAKNIFDHIGEGYFSMLIYTFLVQFLWFFGIHGSNVLEPVIQNQYIEVGNNIFSKSFYDTFVNLGGSGACLCLLIGLLFFARSKEVRYVSKIGALPVFFNISEILSIGLPLLFNPIFFVPYLFIPVINGAISYFVTYIGLVPIVDTSVTWTTPVFFSGYYATGSFAGVILQFVLIIIGVLLYSPFIITYEDKLKAEAINRVHSLVSFMEECEQEQEKPDFLKRNDTLGQTAKVLALDLKDALRDNDVYFKFQPIMDFSGSCIGAEALIRWEHPVVGHIYPPLIIQLAKESGLSRDIDRLLIHRACDLIHNIEKLSRTKIKITINMAVASLLENEIVDMISEAMNKYGVTSSSLCVELTENEVFTNVVGASEVLDILSDKGHPLLIDDFGMGHTSLKYLRANRFNYVKLDSSLTQDICTNQVNQKIIKSMAELGETLGFKLLAEAVETSAQYKKLSELGCACYQGYLFSKPLTGSEFINYHQKHFHLMPQSDNASVETSAE